MHTRGACMHIDHHVVTYTHTYTHTWLHASRQGWTYFPEGFGAKGKGYYFDRGDAARHVTMVGMSVADWRSAYAQLLPPQALLAGLYAGSYIKLTQRKDISHAGYIDSAVTCPFTLTIGGPSLGAAYFRFQVRACCKNVIR
jgi:hypothetical protein